MLKASLIEGKGRGILADRDYDIGEVISIEDVIVNNINNTRLLRKTNLKYYLFDWPREFNSDVWDKSAICLGVGSLYNHSHTNPNMKWSIIDCDTPKIIFKASKKIKRGTELVHNYHWRPSMLKGLI